MTEKKTKKKTKKKKPKRKVAIADAITETGEVIVSMQDCGLAGGRFAKDEPTDSQIAAWQHRESPEVRTQALIAKMLFRLNEQDMSNKGFIQQINQINERTDRIVAAIASSKNVKGL